MRVAHDNRAHHLDIPGKRQVAGGFNSYRLALCLAPPISPIDHENLKIQHAKLHTRPYTKTHAYQLPQTIETVYSINFTKHSALGMIKPSNPNRTCYDPIHSLERFHAQKNGFLLRHPHDGSGRRGVRGYGQLGRSRYAKPARTHCPDDCVLLS